MFNELHFICYYENIENQEYNIEVTSENLKGIGNCIGKSQN